MKKFILTAAVLMSATSLSGLASAATTADEFVQKASISGKFEIDSSKVALQRSTDKEVKAFASKMISDHKKADAKLKATLKTAKISPDVAPKDLDEDHQKMVDDLKSAKAEDFNKNYIDDQKKGHDDTIDLFEDYSKNGDNAALKKFAAATLPTLKMHKDHVEKLEKKDADMLKKEAK